MVAPDAAGRHQPAAFRSAVRQALPRLAWDRLLPSWPLIVGLVAFARLLIERMSLLNDPDTYLHIAAGRWILAHGTLPTHDPFSHSMPGADWITSESLAQVILAATYDALGWGGVILLAAASGAFAVGLLTNFLLRRLQPLPALIAALAAAALLQPHALARPHVLALPLLVAWAGALLAARDEGRQPPFRLLPLMVLWANLHGSFMFGLALAVFLGGEAVLQPGGGRSRRTQIRLWGGFVLAALAAALITPYGIEGVMQPIRLMQMPALQATFAEWMSPDFQKSPALEFWILALMAIGYGSGIRLPLSRLVLLVGLVHMTLQHGRHGDLLAVVAPLAIAVPVDRALAALAGNQPQSRLTAWFTWLARPTTVPAAVLVFVTAALLAMPTALRPILRADDAVTPASALAAAERLGLSGPVLNAEMFGGYLVFRGVPTFIDGRIEMYGNDFLAKAYLAESGNDAVLQELLSRYRIAWTLLAANSGAAGVIEHLSGWEQVYTDGRAVIHRRIGG